MKKRKPAPDLSFESGFRTRGFRAIGADEVGRGCLAGPVVAAAVLLPERVYAADGGEAWWSELNDSKLLTALTRDRLAEHIHRDCLVEIAWSTPEEIDRWNILRASMLAMRRALAALCERLQPAGAAAECALLVDGHLSPFRTQFLCAEAPEPLAKAPFVQIETLVKGDQRSMSIAAASIVAKVHRDRWMAEYEGKYPGYGFAENKGYPAPVHQQALKSLGPCPIHRRSFGPVAAELEARQTTLW